MSGAHIKERAGPWLDGDSAGFRLAGCLNQRRGVAVTFFLTVAATVAPGIPDHYRLPVFISTIPAGVILRVVAIRS